MLSPLLKLIFALNCFLPGLFLLFFCSTLVDWAEVRWTSRFWMTSILAKSMLKILVTASDPFAFGIVGDPTFFGLAFKVMASFILRRCSRWEIVCAHVCAAQQHSSFRRGAVHRVSFDAYASLFTAGLKKVADPVRLGLLIDKINLVAIACLVWWNKNAFFVGIIVVFDIFDYRIHYIFATKLKLLGSWPFLCIKVMRCPAYWHCTAHTAR